MTGRPDETFHNAYLLALARAVEIEGVHLRERVKIPALLRRSIEQDIARGEDDRQNLAAAAVCYARGQLQLTRSVFSVIETGRKNTVEEAS